MNKTFLMLLALAQASVVSRAEEKLDLTYGIAVDSTPTTPRKLSLGKKGP